MNEYIWYNNVAIHEIGEILAPYFVYVYTGWFSLLPRNYPLAHMVVGFWNTFSTFFVSLGQDLVSTIALAAKHF